MSSQQRPPSLKSFLGKSAAAITFGLLLGGMYYLIVPKSGTVAREATPSRQTIYGLPLSVSATADDIGAGPYLATVINVEGKPILARSRSNRSVEDIINAQALIQSEINDSDGDETIQLRGFYQNPNVFLIEALVANGHEIELKEGY